MKNIKKKFMKFGIAACSVAAITAGSTAVLISCGTNYGSKYRPWGTYQLISDYGSIQDKSFNEGVWNGLLAWAYKDYTNASGIITSKDQTIGYTQSSKPVGAQMHKAYLTAINNGAKYLILPGFQHGAFGEGKINEFLEDHPGVRAIGVDTDLGFFNGPIPAKDRVVHIKYNTEQSGFLAAVSIGVFANAPKSQNGNFEIIGNTIKVSTFGGLPFTSVSQYMDGFLQGATWFNDKTTGKKLELVREARNFSGSFDVGDAIQLVKGYADKDVQFVLPVAGGQTNDVITVIKNQVKQNKMFAIGVDTEQSELYGKEFVIGSQMKGLAKGTLSVLENFDTLAKNQGVTYSLKDGVSNEPSEMYVGFAFNPTFRQTFAGNALIAEAITYASSEEQVLDSNGQSKTEFVVKSVCANGFGKEADATSTTICILKDSFKIS